MSTDYTKLTIAAAEIIGWKLGPPLIDPTGKLINSHYNEAWRLPNFITDANASLQLIEWMRNQGWESKIELKTGDWLCVFVNFSAAVDELQSGYETTFPLAILHAFLRANGREDLL